MDHKVSMVDANLRACLDNYAWRGEKVCPGHKWTDRYGQVAAMTKAKGFRSVDLRTRKTFIDCNYK